MSITSNLLEIFQIVMNQLLHACNRTIISKKTTMLAKTSNSRTEKKVDDDSSFPNVWMSVFYFATSKTFLIRVAPYNSGVMGDLPTSTTP